MREIKFRAFHNGKMKNVFGLSLNDGEVRFQNCFYSNYIKGADLCFIMQYTGLKDKNGKEIYEGDVVSHPEIVPPGAELQWDDVYGCWSIGKGWPFSEFPRNEIGEIEVIGNVYENPKLLEELT